MDSFPACSACFEDYSKNNQTPINLCCGHTLCKGCLAKLCGSICPSCAAGIAFKNQELVLNLSEVRSTRETNNVNGIVLPISSPNVKEMRTSGVRVHISHKGNDLSEGHEQMQAALRDLDERTKSVQACSEVAAGVLDDLMGPSPHEEGCLGGAAGEAIRSIREHFVILRRCLEDRECALVQQVQDLCATSAACLKEQLDELSVFVTRSISMGCQLKKQLESPAASSCEAPLAESTALASIAHQLALAQALPVLPVVSSAVQFVAATYATGAGGHDVDLAKLIQGHGSVAIGGSSGGGGAGCEEGAVPIPVGEGRGVARGRALVSATLNRQSFLEKETQVVPQAIMPVVSAPQGGGATTGSAIDKAAGKHELHAEQEAGGEVGRRLAGGSIGAKGSGSGQLQSPFGMCISNDHLYVADQNNHRVQVFSLLAGVNVTSIGSKGSMEGQFQYPFSVCVSDGLLYVSDTANHRVQVFSRRGSFVRSIGVRGTGAGQLQSPYGVCVRDELLYVADNGNNRVQVFYVDGKHVGFIGSGGGGGGGQLQEPSGVCERDGLVYVSEHGQHRVQVFAADGRHVMSIGSQGSGAGQLKYPQGMCVDNGLLYVADFNNRRVQVFSLHDGRHVRSIGAQGRGSGPPQRPSDVCVDSGLLYVADLGTHSVQVIDLAVHN